MLYCICIRCSTGYCTLIQLWELGQCTICKRKDAWRIWRCYGIVADLMKNSQLQPGLKPWTSSLTLHQATEDSWEPRHSAPLTVKGYRLLKFGQTLSQCFTRWVPRMICPRWAPKHSSLGKKCAAPTRVRTSDLWLMLCQMSYRGHLLWELQQYLHHSANSIHGWHSAATMCWNALLDKQHCSCEMTL